MKGSVLLRPLLMVGVLLLAILACLPGPAPTAAPTEPPPPPPTEAAAPPTEAPTEPAAQQYFTEEFDAETAQWSRFVADASIQLTSPGSLASIVTGDVGNMTVGVVDGKLSFDLNSKGLWVYELYDGFEYEDVRLDVGPLDNGTDHQIPPFAQRKQRILHVIIGNGHNHPFKQLGRPLNHIQVAVGDRIKAAGINHRTHKTKNQHLSLLHRWPEKQSFSPGFFQA